MWTWELVCIPNDNRVVDAARREIRVVRRPWDAEYIYTCIHTQSAAGIHTANYHRYLKPNLNQIWAEDNQRITSKCKKHAEAMIPSWRVKHDRSDKDSYYFIKQCCSVLQYFWWKELSFMILISNHLCPTSMLNQVNMNAPSKFDKNSFLENLTKLETKHTKMTRDCYMQSKQTKIPSNYKWLEYFRNWLINNFIIKNQVYEKMFCYNNTNTNTSITGQTNRRSSVTQISRPCSAY